MIKTVAAFGLAGLAAAQDGAPCPPGYAGVQPNCMGDPCNVESSVTAPENGNLGTCGQREFEFIHLRPDPIDESDIALASMNGALGTIGIPFSSWTATGSTLSFDNGAVFWSNPESGPTNGANTGIQVAQLTVPNGQIFSARLNFQGRTSNGCENDHVETDGDATDNCVNHDWEERRVVFTNSPTEMAKTANSYHFVTPSLAVIAGPHSATDGLSGYTTYKLILQLKTENDARNVYAIFGDTNDPALLPAAYQVTQAGFGADIGGTHHSLWTLLPEAQFDSYLTLGAIDMDHPDILDNLHMIAHGETCELACNAGFVMRGVQPTCRAGVISGNTIQCVDPNGSAGRPPAPTPSTLAATMGQSDFAQGSDAATPASSSKMQFGAVQMGVVGLACVALIAAGITFKRSRRVQIMDGKVAESDIFSSAPATSEQDNAMFSGFTIAEN